MSKTLLTAIIAALIALLAAFKVELKGAPAADPKAKTKPKVVEDDDDNEEEEGEGTEESPKVVKGKGTSGKKVKTKLKAPVEDDEEEDDEEDDEEEEETTKPAKGKKPAAKKASVEDADDEEDADDDNDLTLADLRKQARPVINAGHSEEVKSLLESYDADSLTSLEEEHFEAFSKKLAKLAKKRGI